MCDIDIEILTCDCCGRDFVAEDDPVDEAGVIWCPDCRPEY